VSWLTALALDWPPGFFRGPVTLPHVALVEPSTLKGLRGVYVAVKRLDPEAERDGLFKASLQTDVELKLRQSGIRVLTQEELFAAPGKPLLYVNVHLLPNSDPPSIGLYAYAIIVELYQEVRLQRDGSVVVPAATWRAPRVVGTVGASKLAGIRGTVKDLTDQFINAYLAANPK